MGWVTLSPSLSFSVAKWNWKVHQPPRRRPPRHWKARRQFSEPSKAERKSWDRLSWQSEHKMFFVFSVIKRIRPLLTQSTAEVAFGRSKKYEIWIPGRMHEMLDWCLVLRTLHSRFIPCIGWFINVSFHSLASTSSTRANPLIGMAKNMRERS